MTNRLQSDAIVRGVGIIFWAAILAYAVAPLLTSSVPSVVRGLELDPDAFRRSMFIGRSLATAIPTVIAAALMLRGIWLLTVTMGERTLHAFSRWPLRVLASLYLANSVVYVSLFSIAVLLSSDDVARWVGVVGYSGHLIAVAMNGVGLVAIGALFHQAGERRSGVAMWIAAAVYAGAVVFRVPPQEIGEHVLLSLITAAVLLAVFVSFLVLLRRLRRVVLTEPTRP